jgi:hypothetical protein
LGVREAFFTMHACPQAGQQRPMQLLPKSFIISICQPIVTWCFAIFAF